MGLSRRLEQLEGRARQIEEWRLVEREAKELGVAPQEIWDRAVEAGKAIERHKRQGMSEEQAMRACAVEQGLDPERVMATYRRMEGEAGGRR